MLNYSYSTDWLKWKKQFMGYSTRPTLNTVYNNKLKELSIKTSQGQLKQLAEALSVLAKNFTMSDYLWVNTIIDHIKKRAENLGLLGFDFDSENFGQFTATDITANELEEAKKRYLKNHQNIQQIVQNSPLEQQIKIRAIQGKISNLKGEFLELFGENLSHFFKYFLERYVGITLDQLISGFKSGLALSNSVIEPILQENFKPILKSQGTKLSESLNITISEKNIRIRGSQQKIDATFVSPFIQSGKIEEIYQSMKSYSKLRDITLLSNGSILKLMHEISNNQRELEFYANALTIPSYGFVNRNLLILKKIFLLQALAGSVGGKAKILTIYISSKKQFQIFSIHQLMIKLCQNGDLTSYTSFKPDISKNLFNASTAPRTKNPLLMLEDIDKLTIKLKNIANLYNTI